MSDWPGLIEGIVRQSFGLLGRLFQWPQMADMGCRWASALEEVGAPCAKKAICPPICNLVSTRIWLTRGVAADEQPPSHGAADCITRVCRVEHGVWRRVGKWPFLDVQGRA